MDPDQDSPPAYDEISSLSSGIVSETSISESLTSQNSQCDHPASPSDSKIDLDSKTAASSSTHGSRSLDTFLRRIVQQGQMSHEMLRTQRDLMIVSNLLVPRISELYRALASEPICPTLIEAVLVPAAAVSKEWTLSDSASKSLGHVTSLLRVRKLVETDDDVRQAFDSGDESPVDEYQHREFDGWGRPVEGDEKAQKADNDNNDDDKMWWSDQEMAHRLAKLLQPQRDSELSGPSASFLSSLGPLSEHQTYLFATLPDVLDVVDVTFEVQRRAFRGESELKLMESMAGWALVITTRLR